MFERLAHMPDLWDINIADYSLEMGMSRFAKEGALITHVYHCPHHPKFGTEAERGCQCRKPMPGMLEAGIMDYELEAERCIMIGDKRGDMEAATAAGLGRKFLVTSGQSLSPADRSTADDVWHSLKEALQAVCD